MRVPAAACVVALSVAVTGCGTVVTHRAERPRPASHAKGHVRPHRPIPARRPPQFVVASFDGSGGAQLWSYWRGVARRAHAHFTFFVSGVYLVDWAHHMFYRPPRHARGESAIGFAPDRAYVAGTLRQIVLGFRAGHEIGTHYNGHFCAPDGAGVAGWTAVDWAAELAQFRKLLFRSGTALPFGPSEIVGGRTPCLQGDLSILYPVLAAHGFRYDASQTAPLGRWPRRERGLWSFPLLEIPFVGHTFRVVSMDYNFLANQTLETAARVERETYRSIWNAFVVSYRGNRAPLSLGYHFETWSRWAYDHALARFLLVACRLPDVRCASFRELADWLDVKRH